MPTSGSKRMKYKCQSCGEIEELYNSRAGVTPFIVSCLKCGGQSQHMPQSLAEDIYDPEYIPKPGQRVFFSMPLELAQIFARRNLELFEKSAHTPPAAGTAERKELYARLVNNYYHNGEAPCIFTMPELIEKR